MTQNIINRIRNTLADAEVGVPVPGKVYATHIHQLLHDIDARNGEVYALSHQNIQLRGHVMKMHKVVTDVIRDIKGENLPLLEEEINRIMKEVSQCKESQSLRS